MSEVGSGVTEAVFDTIHAELADAGVDAKLITSETKFDDLKIDSIDTEQLLSAIEEQYGVVVSTPELSGLTIGELAAKVVAGQA